MSAVTREFCDAEEVFGRRRSGDGLRDRRAGGRTLLAWGQIPQLISLDDARSRFPTIDGRGQTIVVVDSGVHMGHPKLADSIYKNTAEVLDGRDNDGNGYADDVNGWDFLSNDRDPKDEQGHGTMVASVMAANRFTNTGNPHLAGSAD